MCISCVLHCAYILVLLDFTPPHTTSLRSFRIIAPIGSLLGVWHVSSCLLRRETLISTVLQNLVVCRCQAPLIPHTRVSRPKSFPELRVFFSTVMQARPRPSLDTNVSQYASHALQPHSVDSGTSGTSSSMGPCDSAASALVDPFASLREDSRTADFAGSVQEQASPVLTDQRSRSHSVTSHGSTISKNGVLCQEYYIAKYDYEPDSSNYLPFSAGQLIKIIRKHPSGWWDGELAGRRGWFPSNYLYSDSSRLVRVRSASLESVCPFLRSDPVIPTLPLSEPSTPNCSLHSTALSRLFNHIAGTHLPLLESNQCTFAFQQLTYKK